MRPALLASIAKFAAASTAMQVNDWIGSPAYALGTGDDADIPASRVLQHSVMPYLVRGAIGAGAGLAAGSAIPLLTDATGITTPNDPMGDAAATLRRGGVDVDVDVPAAPKERSWAHFVDEPVFDADTSASIRHWAPAVGSSLGLAAGHNWGRKEEFMHGIRDVRDSGRADVPWDHATSTSPADTYIPWKHRP